MSDAEIEEESRVNKTYKIPRKKLHEVITEDIDVLRVKRLKLKAKIQVEFLFYLTMISCW